MGDTDASPSTRQPFVPPSPPKTPKAAGTRRRLLDVAGGLFMERGYSAVSMREIAAEAGLTHGAIYGHFRSKGQLLVEVIRWKLADRDHTAGFAEATTDPARGVGLMYDESRRDIRLLEVDAAAAARHDPDIAAGLAELYEERHDRIRQAVSDLRDPDTVVWLINALVFGIGMREAIGLPVPPGSQLGDVILEALVGLAAPGSDLGALAAHAVDDDIEPV